MANYNLQMSGAAVKDALMQLVNRVAEGWAVGTKDGAPVGSSSPYFKNNAKYYAALAQSAVPSGVNGAVMWDVDQSGTLSDPEKETARKNIDAAPVTFATPESYGAKGDGVTDDSAAVQAAFDDSLFIQFSAGKTYIVSNIEVRSGHDINLNGATLQTVQDAPIFISDAGDNLAVNRIHIYNGNLKGNSTDATKTNQSLIYISAFLAFPFSYF